MSAWNMSFALFVANRRSFEEMKAPLEEALGVSFEKDAEYQSMGHFLYKGYALGLELSFLLDRKRAQENIYRFTGMTADWLHHDAAETLDIGFHIRKILEGIEGTRIMTIEEIQQEAG